jgi:3-hydroxyisobutyrate dehydrogenase-like beta-hydroxyacid dehydrogenase
MAVSPRDVVEHSDVVLSMLADPKAVRAVIYGQNGAMEGMSQGKGYIEMSTIDPGTSREIHCSVSKKGCRYLEAPVSGSLAPAQAGKLIIMTAGDKSLFDDAETVFSAIGKKSYYLGDTGNAAILKLCLNAIMGGMLLALFEGVRLGEAAGLNAEKIFGILGESAMAAPIFTDKSARVLRGDYAPAFPLKHLQKDINLALSLGDSLHYPIYESSTLNNLLKAAIQQGYSEEDVSALYKVL